MPDWLIAILCVAAIAAVLVKAFWTLPKADPRKSDQIGRVPPDVLG